MRPNTIKPNQFKDIVDTSAKLRESISILKTALVSIPAESVCLAFSGGKDSIVAAHIAHKYLGIKSAICELSFCLPNHILDFKKSAEQFGLKVSYKSGLDWRWLSKNPQYIFPKKEIRGKFYSLRQQKTIKKYCLEMGFKACITGRRGQENTIKLPFYYTKDRVLQIHPLAAWKTEDIWSYIIANKLFYPRLYDSAYGLEGASSWVALFDEHYPNGREGCWQILFEEDENYFKSVLIERVEEAKNWYINHGKKTV